MTVMSCENAGKNAASAEMTSRNDSVAYFIGVNQAQQFQELGIEVNPDAFLQGLRDATGDQDMQLNEQTMQELLMAVQQQAATAQAEQQRKMQETNITEGQMAPEISLPTPDGEVLSLSDLRGKYVLIDFWAAWCRPCRAENPNVVRVYNQYKDKGFEILGVSLDRTREEWLQAIEADGLTWKHVSDIAYFNSEAAQTYGVKSIPYTVLVDPEGKVIAQRLRGGSLQAKLAEIFGS